jgi:urease beta subunit
LTGESLADIAWTYRREVWLIPYGGARLVYGFNQAVMGALPPESAS